jgi:hypothetical protein
VKTKDAAKKPGLGKQGKQFAALGLLSAVLVAVLVVQMNADAEEYQVAALSEGAVVADAEPAPDEGAAAPEPEAQDNPVLSQSSAELELQQNPFTNFWSRGGGDTTSEAPMPPPSVVLGLTIPGGDRPLAVIDGVLRFVGDDVQGWLLESVRARAIVLTSPAGEQLVVEMPLYQTELLLPPASSAR